MPTLEATISQEKEALHEALLFAYRDIPTLSRMLSYKMKIDLQAVVPNGPMNNVVFDLLNLCEADGRLTELLEKSSAFKPDSPKLKRFKSQHLPTAELPIDSKPTIERVPLVFGVDFLTSSLLELAMCVGRIELNNPIATGFLVGPDLFLTCQYVVPMLGDIKNSQVVFPLMDALKELKYRPVSFSDSWKVTFSPADHLDYALLRLSEPIGNETFDGRRRGWLSLASSRLGGVASLEQFHYPNGLSLALSFVSTLIGASQSRLEYEYATSPGSGGAPCINDKSQVVAMHEKRSANRERGVGIHAADILQDLTRQGTTL